MTRIIALSGGRSGVGTTTVAVQLAAQLAAAGQRVCLLELVSGATAASRLLDVAITAMLSDRLSETNAGQSIAAAVPQGFDLVAAGRGRNWLRDLSAAQLMTVSDGLPQLQDYDFVLIDTGIGTDQNQLAFSLASPELLLVITPEPESRSDAYALLKLLYAEQYGGVISVLVNKSTSPATGQHAYDRFRDIASFYLDMQLPLAAIIGTAETVAHRERSAKPPAGSPISDIQTLANSLLAQDDAALQRDLATFSAQLLQSADAVAAVDVPAEFKPVFTAPQPERDLHEQLAQLSAQVDGLIATVERLRLDEMARDRTLPARPAERERCSVASIAAIASRSERVTVAGETFAIYHMRSAGGRQQRFACQSIDDDLEEPEPQTRSS